MKTIQLIKKIDLLRNSLQKTENNNFKKKFFDSLLILNLAKKHVYKL